ncbi:MAG: hypothetical protein HY788_02865 [Deltaproteobacteria bacterium]|nr:hypothetical protein [Deltaproteobacteria bacterium]
MRHTLFFVAVIFPAVLVSTALAEIWCYDANKQFLGVHQSGLTFFLPEPKKSFELSATTGYVAFSPYYFQEDGCEEQPYTMLPMNRIALGPDGKLHSGSSPLVRFIPGSYLNARNGCVRIEAGQWTEADSFSKPVEISDSEIPIAFPVAFPLTYKYVQAGSVQYGKVHTGTPARTPPQRRRYMR